MIVVKTLYFGDLGEFGDFPQPYARQKNRSQTDEIGVCIIPSRLFRVPMGATAVAVTKLTKVTNLMTPSGAVASRVSHHQDDNISVANMTTLALRLE
jgi:hypothetical protein